MSHKASAETRTYGLVYVALLILLALTTEAARWNFGNFNITLTLLIATCKAALIMTFFMHLNHRSALVVLMATAGFFWLTIMFLLTLADYTTRPWLT